MKTLRGREDGMMMMYKMEKKKMNEDKIRGSRNIRRNKEGDGGEVQRWKKRNEGR